MASQMASWVISSVLFISLLSAPALSVDDSLEYKPGPVFAYNGAVASDDERCSVIGRDILEDGGHAVDAAVAVAFCEGVVRPATSGIGGGGFMTIKNGNEIVALDMREFAPGYASEDMYHGNVTMKHYGIHSIAVPGQLKGLYVAWKMYGRLPWQCLVLPSEILARYGFTISKNLHEMMTIAKDYIMNDKGLKRVFTHKGKLLKAGEICKNVQLADTLRQIRVHGADVYYNGPLGEKLIKDIQENGGNITMDDLRSYDIELKSPVSISMRELGLKLYGVPPPASGAASIFLILNILAQYGFPLWINDRGLQAHRRVEALKHSFAVRMNLGDPNFVDIKPVLESMLSLDFAHELKKTINDNKTFNPLHYGGKWNLWNETKEDGTTHYCVVDKERNAVSVTTTINWYFGSGFLSPRTGIILNNHMDDFSMPFNCTSLNCTFSDSSCTCTPPYYNCSCCDLPPPAPANFIKAYKRPLSASSPIIIMQGNRLRGVIGASGGPRIIGATTEVFLNYFVGRMSAYNAVKEGRYYDPLVPSEVEYEDWENEYGQKFSVPLDIRKGLEHRGHKVMNMTGEPGNCQFIVQEFPFQIISPHGTLVAVSDPRYGGKAAGY